MAVSSTRRDGRARWSATASLVWAVAAIALAGCMGSGLYDDGTSVSYGPPNRGALLNAGELPVKGDGYVMPPEWAKRGLHYGSEELLAALTHVARTLDAAGVGRPLAIADLSPRHGGPSRWHRSHQTGRDVDLIFFVRDPSGRAIVPETMRRFDGDGKSIADRRAEGAAIETAVQFDDRANWMLVRALLLNPAADIQWMFISDPLKQRLLNYAVQSGESDDLIALAAILLHQPSRGLAHDDHIHVRVHCAAGDVALGCREMGPMRWLKKGYKYRRDGSQVAARRESDPRAGEAPHGALAMIALPTLPFRGFVPK